MTRFCKFALQTLLFSSSSITTKSFLHSSSNRFAHKLSVITTATAAHNLRALHVVAKNTSVISKTTSSSSLSSTSGNIGTTDTDTDTDKMCINTDENANPLLKEWTDEPFMLPPFPAISPSHFAPAFTVAMKEHLDDLQAIAANESAPTFSNTIAAYDRAGGLLDKISSVFSNFCSSLNTEELKEVQKDMVPILSRHSSQVYTLDGLFERIKTIHDDQLDVDNGNDNDTLTLEQKRLVERLYLDFTRQGANFTDEQKEEYANIKAQLASLTTQFAQNVMKDEESFEIVLSKQDMEGCPEALIQAAKQAAQDRAKADDHYVITLSRSLVEPFLTYASKRDLRQKVWNEWSRRGELTDERNNLPLAIEMLKLRKRQAELHGCKTFAEYQCQDRMAKTPEKVMELLENVWQRAKLTADKEREALELYCREIGDDLGEEGVQAWDWRYYAEKVRIQKYDFDESVFKPYLSLEKVTEAVMAVSNKLYGLKYVKRDDIESYHEDVDTYEVYYQTSNGDGGDEGEHKLKAVFIHDNFARKFKSSGAWMSEYRGQTKNLNDGVDDMQGIPIISNNNNFAKGSGTAPTLLSFDDATTLFHEMGHGHHGMLSDATYGRLAGTNVLTDFVELPSQLMEHWLEEPEVLKEYARHFETNEPVPDEMLEKFKAAKSFNQGFETIEYTSCALMDMALHQMEDYDDLDLAKFEQEELGRLGMPKGVIMRHRPAHFLHLFASNMYAAGYYVYLWAEVLDADVFAAFKETGNIFDKETAERCRKYIYSSGNTVAPDELFRLFRGRDPKIEFMLEKKGLS